MLLSPRACLPILFFFSWRCTLVPFPSLFPLPDGETCVPRPRGRGSPQLDFLHFAYFLLHSLPLHLRVSAVARILPSDLSSRATAATLRSHFFFRHGGFLRPMRVDFFLIRTHIRVRPPCIKVSSRSSGFFYHDNVPGYFRVYLSTSSSFPLVLSPTSFLTPVLRTITVCTSHILVSFHMSSRVFPRVIPLSPSLSLPPPFSPLKCVRSFCAPLRTASARSIYTEYLLFLEVLHPSITSVLESATTSPSRPTSCSTYDGGTQLHYRQQLRLEASATRPPER